MIRYELTSITQITHIIHIHLYLFGWLMQSIAFKEASWLPLNACLEEKYHLLMIMFGESSEQGSIQNSSSREFEKLAILPL